MTDASKTGWYSGMASPNPAGRPKGIVDRHQKLQAAFADDAPAVARVVIEAALAGDMMAANIALARVAPPLKAQAEKVQFELSPHRSLSDQATQILLAVSEGKLDGESARVLIGCIHQVAGIRAIEGLEERIITLEAKQVAA